MQVAGQCASTFSMRSVSAQARASIETQWEDMLLPPWALWRELQEIPLSSLLLVSFAGEGVGNTSEAAVLASVVQAAMENLQKSFQKVTGWRAPVSWSHLFGNTLVEELY